MALPLREMALQNTRYRKVLKKGKHLELTVMNVDEVIPLEIHEDTDQFIYVVSGVAEISFYLVDDQQVRPVRTDRAHEDEVLYVPAGTYHEVHSVGATPLKLFSVYAHGGEY